MKVFLPFRIGLPYFEWLFLLFRHNPVLLVNIMNWENIIVVYLSFYYKSFKISYISSYFFVF